MPPPPESFATRLLRWKFNLFPAFFGTGGRIRHISADFKYVRVTVPLNWRTRNYVGTIFGGSIYGAVDPVFMVMFIKLLGRGYAVWDKAATIRFVRPGRTTLTAEFRISDEELARVRDELGKAPRIERKYQIELKDEEGATCAYVEKTLHFRANEPGANPASHSTKLHADPEKTPPPVTAVLPQGQPPDPDRQSPLAPAMTAAIRDAASGSDANAFGVEGWIKLITIFLAFLYVCGYGGVMGFTSSLGLTPGDLGLSEKDFLIYGIVYLLPDPGISDSIAGHTSTTGLMPWCVWSIVGLLFPVVFAFSGKTRYGTWVGLMIRSALLLALGIALLSTSQGEGERRADRAMSRANRLPTVMVGYHVEGSTNGPSFLYGSLVARTDKVVCVGLAQRHFYEGQEIEVGLTDKMFIIPTERILLLSAVVPANLPRQRAPAEPAQARLTTESPR